METVRTDNVDAVAQALAKLMAITDRVDARNAQTVQRIEALAAAMEHATQRLDAGGERFAAAALQTIAGHAQQAMGQVVAQTVGPVELRLEHAANSASAAARAMDDELATMVTARRGLVWNGLLALLVGTLLALGATAWVVYRSGETLTQARLGQDIVQAMQRGTITRCGDSLCAKVGKRLRRYGKDGEYLLLSE
jgi:hypothetical protein